MHAIIMAGLIAAAGLGDFQNNPDPELRKLAALPHDVRVHIDRAINCHHWAGEEAYNDARRREIDAAVDELQCDGLDREAQALRHRYRAIKPILKVIRKYEGDLD